MSTVEVRLRAQGVVQPGLFARVRPRPVFSFEDESACGAVVAAVDAVLAQSTRAAVVASVVDIAMALLTASTRCRRRDPRRAAMKQRAMERRKPSSLRSRVLFVLLDRRAVYPAIGCAGRI
jgi:hypothetical protein